MPNAPKMGALRLVSKPGGQLNQHERTPITGKPQRRNAGWSVANRNRTQAAAARTVAASKVISAISPDPVLQLRIDYPDASLAELASIAGLTKHQYAGRLRRRLETQR
jgi:DNA-binding transcriptional regulator WhiA